MKLSLLFACTVWLFAPTQPATEVVRFRPEPGSELRKVFEIRTEMEMTELSVSMNGEPVPPEALSGASMAVEETVEVTFTDRYVEVADGRPLKLERSFESLAQHSVLETTLPGQEPKDEHSSSDLEGQTVVFEWDADEEQFSAEPDEDSDVSAELLGRLEEDTDMRAFLPEGEVDVDDGWDLDALAVSMALDPGGDLGLDADGGADERELDDMLKANTEGDVRATFTGTREEEGTRVAVIRFKGELTSAAEITTQAGSEQSFEVSMEVEGVLLWDLDRGHAHSLEVDMQSVLEVVESNEAQGFVAEVSLSGSMRLEGTAERVE